MVNITVEKIYRSELFKESLDLKFDEKNKVRPSWIRTSLDKGIIFIKIVFNGEAFWYRRYFQDYFFPLDSTSEDYRNYYDQIAEDYESYVPQNKEFSKLLLELFKELGIRKDSKILDFGAGTGLVTEHVAVAGYDNLTLVDISKEELKIAKKKKSLAKSDFQVIDVTKQNLPGKFDLIFETMSLDYFKGEKMNSILLKIADALNAKGKFILIDRHSYPEFKIVFKEIRSGKINLNTPEGNFDYFFFVGEKR